MFTYLKSKAMKKLLSLIILAAVFFSQCVAQEEVWFEEDDLNIELQSAYEQGEDEFLVGGVNSKGEIQLATITKKGKKVTQTSIKSSELKNVTLQSLYIISEDKFLVVGRTKKDLIYARIDKDGAVKFKHIIEEGAAPNGTIRSIIPTENGGIAMCGNFGSKLTVVKITGDKVDWKQEFGGLGTQKAMNLYEMNNGNFLLGAYSDDFNTNDFDILIYELDNKGNFLNTRTLGQTGSKDIPFSIIESHNGQPLMGGYSNELGWVVELEKDDYENYNIAWTHTFGKAGSQFCRVSVIIPSGDGYFAVGHIASKEQGKSKKHIFTTKFKGKKLKKTKEEPKIKEDDFIRGYIEPMHRQNKTNIQFDRTKVEWKTTHYATVKEAWEIGQGFQLLADINQCSNLYIFSIDNEEVQTHFPRNKVDKIEGDMIVIPNKESDLGLVKEGTDYIYMLWAREPIEDIEKIQEAVKKAAGDKIQALKDALGDRAIDYHNVKFEADRIEFKTTQAGILPLVLTINGVKKAAPLPTANLHMLSIGVNHGETLYSEADAKAVADKFDALSNSVLFNEVNVNALVGQEATYSNIYTNIALIKEESLKAEDVIVVFLSGQTKETENGTAYKPNDYSQIVADKTTIPISNIINALETLPCKKIFLLDAALPNLPKINDENTCLLMASENNEAIYEDQNSKHGAFTKALLEGLDTKSESNTITITALFEYINKNVQEITASKISGKQVPKFVGDNMENLIIFQ